VTRGLPRADQIVTYTGTVRLKKKVDAADEMALDTRSTKTARVAAASDPARRPPDQHVNLL
jgi:hypothetical protein